MKIPPTIYFHLFFIKVIQIDIIIQLIIQLLKMNNQMLDFLSKGQVQLKDIEASIKDLPLPEKIKCVAIYKRYKQIREVEDKMNEQTKKVQKKYLKLDEPVIRKLADIANGSIAIDQADVKEPEKYLNEEEIKKIPDCLAPRKISSYWFKCLSSSKILKSKMGPDDETLLKHLEDINVVDEEGTDNFTVVFKFSENTIISNPQLQKKFFIKNDEAYKCESTVIEWKQKNLTKKEVKKKQKNKKTGQHRMVVKTVDAKSFFNFFRTIDAVNTEKNPLELNEEELNLRNQLDDDFEIGGIIVDEIIPYSLEYYLGIEHDDDEDMEFDEEQEDNDDDEDKPQKKKSGSKSKSKSKGKKKDQPKTAAEKPDCKQQ